MGLFDNINGTNDIALNWNGSQVDTGLMLSLKRMQEASRIQKNIGDAKGVANQAQQQFQQQSTIPIGAMTASQHTVGSGINARPADTARELGLNNVPSGIKLDPKNFASQFSNVKPGNLKLDGIKSAVGGKDIGGVTGGAMSAASGAIDAVSGMIKNRPEYSGKHGSITKGMDKAYDATMKAVGMIPGWGQVAQLAMGAGKLLNKAVGRLGGGTDGMTKADAILGSNFLGLTPFGLINGFGGKKANTYTRNEELDKSTNGGFSGFLTTQTSTEEGAGKKFGLFSRIAMNKQNELTEFTTNMKHTISGVVDTNTLNNMAAQGSIPFLAQQQQMDLSGGIQQMRAARQGMQFSRRVVSKYAIGNKLKRSIQTIDVATGKYVEVPTDLTKEQIQGKVPIRLANGTAVFMNKDGTVSSERWETVGEREHLTPKGEKGLKAKHWQKPSNWSEEKIPYNEWVKDVNPEYLNPNYDLELAYKYLPKEQLERWKFGVNSNNPKYYSEYKDSNGNYIYHLGSIVQIPNSEDYIFLKKGTEKDNPELHFETDMYYNGENGLKPTHNLSYEGDRYYYRRKPNFRSGEFVQNGNIVSGFKEGGQMNVIPEGALHARLHHMDNVDPNLAKQITHKGIPVITVEKDGEIIQHAEIEHSEIIFTLEVTNKIEDLRKKYHEDKKDEYAIEAGKILVEEILHNTDDRTNLIANVE